MKYLPKHIKLLSKLFNKLLGSKPLIITTFLILLPMGFLRLYHHKNPLPIIFQSLPIPSTILGPPKGYVFAKEKYPNNYIKIFSEEKPSLPPFPLMANLPPVTFPEAFVLQLDNARVYGCNGLIITDEDRVLADTAIDWIPSIDQHKIFRKNKLPKVEVCEETIAVIASKSAECFYHWMLDVLPRLELLQQSHLTYDKIYLNPLKCPFQKETISHLFQQLDLDESKIIWALPKSHIRAKKLIIPSFPGGATPWVRAFLNKHFLKTPSEQISLPKKIYISRKNAPTRKIVNEKELVSALEQQGFTEILLEQLSVFEQAELFASAECIVAPHGAGLTHLVFCQENTRVIEIFNPHYLNRCYWNISHSKNLHHTYLLGSQENLSDVAKKQNDMWVNVEEVISQL